MLTPACLSYPARPSTPPSRTPLTRHCARATLAPLAQQLMQQALPHKWLQQLDPPPDEATAASGLLRLGSAAPCSGSSQELEAAAAMAAKAKEEAAAAAAVAAAEAAEAAARAREKAKEEAERRRLEAFLLQDEHREAAKKVGGWVGGQGGRPCDQAWLVGSLGVWDVQWVRMWQRLHQKRMGGGA